MPSYEINQFNDNGDNNVYINNMELDIDVEWIRNIIYNNKEKIKKLLAIFNKKNKNSNDTDIMKDIEDKNKKNDLETFYDKFIKKYENEMDILFNFFSNEEMIEEIEIASENIRIAIYSISKSEKLTPKIFNEILQKHTKILNDNEDKKLMRLMIFFLYRHCFIGKV